MEFFNHIFIAFVIIINRGKIPFGKVINFVDAFYMFPFHAKLHFGTFFNLYTCNTINLTRTTIKTRGRLRFRKLSPEKLEATVSRTQPTSFIDRNNML
ncbi:hypothetical protein C1H46_021137 [Malus baccata]|uniref:Uncharacterized protein n=1 Tax=Malus baccata TaxID=106549 RepID=A0A540M405_MALBA|nr:hypothetical protein C1H46_021137 [Malus baccata]